MKRIVCIVVAALLLGVVEARSVSASEDLPDITVPEAPGCREIGNGRYDFSPLDYTTEEPQPMEGMPSIREIGYGLCLEREALYYTAKCVEGSGSDEAPYWCRRRFWCCYAVAPKDGACQVTVWGMAGPNEWLELRSPDGLHQFFHPFRAGADGNFALFGVEMDEFGLRVFNPAHGIYSKRIDCSQRYWQVDVHPDHGCRNCFR